MIIFLSVCQFPFLLSCLCFRWEEIVGQWEENSAPPPPLPPPSPSPSSTAGGRIDASVPAGMSPVFLSAFPPSCPSDPGSYFRDRIDSGIANSSPPPPPPPPPPDKQTIFFDYYFCYLMFLFWFDSGFASGLTGSRGKQGATGTWNEFAVIAIKMNVNWSSWKTRSKRVGGGGAYFPAGSSLPAGIFNLVLLPLFRATHTHTHTSI